MIGSFLPLCDPMCPRLTTTAMRTFPVVPMLSAQNAAIMVQVTVRRCIAFSRVKKIRHRRRGQAQARIARAARQRALFVRQKELEGRQREEENASAMATMRVRYLMNDPDAPTCSGRSVPQYSSRPRNAAIGRWTKRNEHIRSTGR